MAWDGMHKKGVLDLTWVGMHAMACMIFVENDGTSCGGANQYPTGCWFGGGREGILQVSNWLLVGCVCEEGSSLPIFICLLFWWMGREYSKSIQLVSGWVGP